MSSAQSRFSSGRPQPKTVAEPTPALLKTALLFWVGAVLLAGGGVVLGFGLASWWGVLAGLGGLAAGLLAAMAGAFAIPGQPTGAGKSRFNLLTLVGLLVPLAGLALGWYLGGLVGVGAGLLLLGLGALVTGVGIAVGAPE